MTAPTVRTLAAGTPVPVTCDVDKVRLRNYIAARIRVPVPEGTVEEYTLLTTDYVWVTTPGAVDRAEQIFRKGRWLFVDSGYPGGGGRVVKRLAHDVAVLLAQTVQRDTHTVVRREGWQYEWDGLLDAAIDGVDRVSKEGTMRQTEWEGLEAVLMAQLPAPLSWEKSMATRHVVELSDKIVDVQRGAFASAWAWDKANGHAMRVSRRTWDQVNLMRLMIRGWRYAVYMSCNDMESGMRSLPWWLRWVIRYLQWVSGPRAQWRCMQHRVHTCMGCNT